MHVIPYNENELTKLIHLIYDNSSVQNPTTEILFGKEIVYPKNNTTQEINNNFLIVLLGAARLI